MLAVILTGGKQYLVSPGQKVKIEKLENKEGDEIVFDQVLLVEKSNKIAATLRGITWIANPNPNLRKALKTGLEL